MKSSRRTIKSGKSKTLAERVPGHISPLAHDHPNLRYGEFEFSFRAREAGDPVHPGEFAVSEYECEDRVDAFPMFRRVKVNECGIDGR